MSIIMVRIQGVEGEATLAGYQGQIECLSMRHAIDLKIDRSGAETVGEARHGPIELTHSLDKASPSIKLDSCAGRNLGTVTISRLRMISGTPKAVETITLMNAYVVRVDIDTPIDPSTREPGDELMETFSLEYSDIVWDYKHFVNNIEHGTVTGAWSDALQTTNVTIPT